MPRAEKMAELKPCPFCGGEAKLKHGFPGQQQQGMRQATVQCKTCGCRTVTYRQFPYEPWKNVDEYAIFVWNKRTAEDALSDPPLTLDELRELEGEPVWIESPDMPNRHGWAINYGLDPDVMHIQYAEIALDMYGKTWLAYRRRPEQKAPLMVLSREE